jgi:hypothetical protein
VASHHYRRDNVFRIHGSADTTPWTNPQSYQPEKVDPVEHLRITAKRRRSVFEAVCDGIADFIADCIERPGTALTLISVGQMSIVIPAILWALLS